MNNRAVNISSLVILLSLVSFIAEACLYYLINYHWVSILFAVLFSVGLSHFCLESSLNYGYSFLHAAFMVTITFIFSAVIYLIQPNQWIHYDFSMVVLVLVNWITPFIYCNIRDMLDRGPRFDGFHLFFQRMSILFIVFFLFVVVKQYFLTPITPPYQELPFGAHNFVPMMTTASYIEFAINSHTSLLYCRDDRTRCSNRLFCTDLRSKASISPEAGDLCRYSDHSGAFAGAYGPGLGRH